MSFAHVTHSVARRAYPESQMSHFFSGDCRKASIAFGVLLLQRNCFLIAQCKSQSDGDERVAKTFPVIRS